MIVQVWHATLENLRNRTTERLRTTEKRKNVAQDWECTVSRDIFSSWVLSLPAVLLRKVFTVCNNQEMIIQILDGFPAFVDLVFA